MKILTAGSTLVFLGLTFNTTQAAFAEEEKPVIKNQEYKHYYLLDSLNDFSLFKYDSILNPNYKHAVVISVTEDVPEEPVAPPPPSKGQLLAENALAQVGVAQDCTALVENALRALGYSVGDLAPMGFSSYGYQVDPSQAQAGDIMMRDGHVAIYLGNGRAVHGGFNGMTVESDYDASPYGYALIVRL